MISPAECAKWQSLREGVMVQNTVNAVFSRFRFPNSEDVDAHETGKYPRESKRGIHVERIC